MSIRITLRTFGLQSVEPVITDGTTKTTTHKPSIETNNKFFLSNQHYTKQSQRLTLHVYQFPHLLPNCLFISLTTFQHVK